MLAVRKIKIRDLVVVVVLLMLATHIYLEAREMSEFGISLLSPGMFPALLSIVLVALACWLALSSVTVNAASSQGELDREAEVLPTRSEFIRIVVALGWIFSYIVVLPLIHFLIATSLFLAGLLFFLKAGRPLPIIAVSATTAVMIDVFFRQIFQIGLP